MITLFHFLFRSYQSLIFIIGLSSFVSVYAKTSPSIEYPLHYSQFAFELLGGVTEAQGIGSSLPGGQGGFSIRYQDEDRLFRKIEWIGAKIRFDLIGGLPALRMRLDADTPALVLKNFEDERFYYTPLILRGFFTHAGSSERVGPDGSMVGNSYGLFSSRFGFQFQWGKLGTTSLLGKVEWGPEAGYLKDLDHHAPFAGFVAVAQAHVESTYVFANLLLEGHFNVLAAFPTNVFAKHGLSTQAELGFPIASVGRPAVIARISAGLKTHLDYFDITSETDFHPSHGLSIFGGAFLRGEIGGLR